MESIHSQIGTLIFVVKNWQQQKPNFYVAAGVRCHVDTYIKQWCVIAEYSSVVLKKESATN